MTNCGETKAREKEKEEQRESERRGKTQDNNLHPLTRHCERWLARKLV